MAERTEIDCQKISNNWYKFSHAAYCDVESLFGNKDLSELIEIAKRSSYCYVTNLYALGPKYDLDYAAQDNGRMHWFYKNMQERGEEIHKKQTLASTDLGDPHFDLVLTQTYIAWRFLESYYLISNLPLSFSELQTSTNTLKSILGTTRALLIEYKDQLPHQFTKVQDYLLDLSRGRIRLLNQNPDFDMNIPYFRSQ